MQEKPKTRIKAKKQTKPSGSIKKFGLKTEKPRLSKEEQKRLDGELLVSSDDAAEINRLVKAGADIESVDEGGNTVLHYVASCGYIDSCSAILSRYAESGRDVKRLIEKANFAWNNPLHMAAFWGRTEICSLILAKYWEAGGDAKKLIDKKNKMGETALTGAKSSGGSNAETVKFLSNVRMLNVLPPNNAVQFLQDFRQCIGQ